MHVMVIPCVRGVWLIYTPGPGAEGVYISQITSTHGITNAKQKHLGCKKVRGQSEATLQTGRRDQKV